MTLEDGDSCAEKPLALGLPAAGSENALRGTETQSENECSYIIILTHYQVIKISCVNITWLSHVT